MLDLKGPIDLVMAAEAAWKKQAAEIADLLSLGTEEATQQALALQDTLDKLQADYEAKKDLYDRLVAANSPSDLAKLFVPASPTSPEGEENPKGVMPRKEFFALSPTEQKKFALGGGKVTE